MEMIKTVDLHKSYGELHVLKGVNQTIEKGEVVSIIGTSGVQRWALLLDTTGVSVFAYSSSMARISSCFISWCS